MSRWERNQCMTRHIDLIKIQKFLLEHLSIQGIGLFHNIKEIIVYGSAEYWLGDLLRSDKFLSA